MANKQTTPNTKLDGAFLKKGIKSSPLSANTKRVYADNTFGVVASSVIDATQGLISKKKETDFKKYAMNTDFALSNYRENVSNAQNMQEIEQLEENTISSLEQAITSKEHGEEFWNIHGKKLVEINHQDTNSIKAKKSLEFGRNSLETLLQDSQNWLTQVDSNKAGLLLNQGVVEIQENPFLTKEEKKIYENEFLGVGILNIALNNPDDALNYLDIYQLDSSAEINDKILEVKKIKQENQLTNQIEAEKKNYLNTFNNAQSLWQNMVRKNISPEQYYVLSKDIDENILINNDSLDKEPLLNAYNIIKKMNAGNVLEPTEVKQASNHLANAYYQKKLGFEEIAELQDKLLLSQVDNNTANLMFDTEIDELADRVLFKDITNIDDDIKKSIMNQKANFALNLYQDYYEKKAFLAQDWQNKGANITPSLEKKIRKQALNEIKEELDIKENSFEALSYADFNIYLNNNYSGGEKDKIWNNFIKLSTSQEDKMTIFKEVVERQKLKEQNYPHFNTFDEVKIAGLEAGDKFYLDGKLEELVG